MTGQTISLIVNADDYGRTPGVSLGIREAHLKGIVTSTTAMMNMPGVEEALAIAQKECPRLGLGVHLVLTSGSPIRPIQAVGSLTGGKKNFPGLEGQSARIADLRLDEVRTEWAAQIDKFVACTGHQPDHLDSHHHSSYFSEGLFDLMLNLAADHHCAIRLPNPNEAGIYSTFPGEIGNQAAVYFPVCLKNRSIRAPKRFIDTFYDEAATLPVVKRILDRLPEGTHELMCHPAHADAELISGSSYNKQRERELEVLTSNEVKDIIKRRDIRLINFAQL